MGDLAREAFELELGRTLRLERHRRSGVTAHGVASRALMRDQHLARRERESLHRDRSIAAFISSLGERLPDPRQVLAELRSEHSQVRLDGLSHETLGLVADLELLHVELILHDVRELGTLVE